jgi:predicted nucleotide-binding protein
VPPQIEPAQGIELLSRQIADAEAFLKARSITRDQWSAWELVTRNFLEKAFGSNSPNVSSVIDVGKYGFVRILSETEWEQERLTSLTTQVSRLRGLVELLRTEVQLQNTGVPEVGSKTSRAGHRIFLVHGHDELALHETGRFLEKLRQDVLILREQPSRGRTIIEKFEDYSDVGFAIVLLTPDDKGGVNAGPVDEQRFRARQNVIFEFGYFIGRLGRNRVCALYKAGVEIPSDYSGVLYLELDGRGAWKLELAKELKAASLPVDMNLAL